MIVNLTGANQLIIVNTGTPVYYRGISVLETAAAPALLRIWDNASAASGLVLDEVALSASQSAREAYDGFFAAQGIFVQIVSGTVVGSIRI